MKYRVIQWATGGVGRAAIQGIVNHPELELVGCWVHSRSKDGRDAGELAGIAPLGVDVLAVQPGSTRTPGWQSSQPPELRGPGPHVMEPSEVVATALSHLGDGPNVVPGEMNQQGVAMLSAMPRAQAVGLVSRITRKLVPNV